MTCMHGLAGDWGRLGGLGGCSNPDINQCYNNCNATLLSAAFPNPAGYTLDNGIGGSQQAELAPAMNQVCASVGCS